MKIETERLVITDLTPDMAMDLHLNSLDEENRRFVPDEVFETPEEALETIGFLMEQYGTEDGPLVHPVLTKEGVNVGYVQLCPVEEGWEIGYHLGEKYRGKGYASEAVKAFLPVIAAEKKLDTVYAICVAENTASEKLMKRCGFDVIFRGMGTYQEEERPIVKAVWHS